ncbi:RcpC/CpaB family pilus assembly protein [Streptomyces sp. NPDC052225]|uniref:RcpC/CpaB family pilus assembly protein n=1 Tax=Streptomyces sp. NPDC052225 TaxID=3154949 RepID=UPI003448B693
MPSFPSPPARLSTPPTSEVPAFPPVRVRGGRLRSGRRGGPRRARPAVAAGLALTAAALVAAVPSPGAGHGHERAQAPPGQRARGPAVMVSAPVRIADAGAVRLLRPGDRVDVVAGRADGRPGVRVLASGARVVSVPKRPPRSGEGLGETFDGGGETPAAGGALVVLSVERRTAARLAGAGTTSRLAVTLW